MLKTNQSLQIGSANSSIPPDVLIPSTVDTIDLSKPFVNTDPSIWSYISKNGTHQTAPTLNDGSIFADSSSLYLFGGGISVANDAKIIGAPTKLPDNGVWQYDLTEKQWTMAVLGGSVPQRMVMGMSAQSSSSPTAYYLGGAHAPNSDPYFWTVPFAVPYLDQGLLSFDESTASFQNVSTVGLNPYGTVAGGFVNLIESIGSKGVLVAFGGISSAAGISQNLTETYWTDPSLHWNISSVSVYDIGGQIWYQQTTTGDVPRWRYNGCSGQFSPGPGFHKHVRVVVTYHISIRLHLLTTRLTQLFSRRKRSRQEQSFNLRVWRLGRHPRQFRWSRLRAVNPIIHLDTSER